MKVQDDLATAMNATPARRAPHEWARSSGTLGRCRLPAEGLEDRAFYVFDEWAADQDPLFKEVFYFQLLPELKARGKTVLVSSHDDCYYHVADRIAKLDYGQIVSRQGQATLAQPG